MELTDEQYEIISRYLPRQRGNVKVDNRLLLNALLYVTENGCKWRALPERYGKWATVYKRINRWCKSGVLKRVFEALQRESICLVKIELAHVDSIYSCKVHPNGCGALKKWKTGDWKNEGWTDKVALGLSLSGGNEHDDAREGRKLLTSMERPSAGTRLLLDKAYEGDETRKTAEELGYIPVVPPKINRKNRWEYDRELYKQRNIVERAFRRLKEFRRVFTRYDKLDDVFIGFVYFGLTIIMIK